MSELKEKLQQVTKEIDENITNKSDATFVKEKISELCIFFLDEIERIVNIEEKKLTNVALKQKDLEDRLDKMEHSINHIESDIYVDEENCDYEVVCPYCGNEFVASNDNDSNEIECPECNNTIELDWSCEEDYGCCNGGCNCCYNDDKNETNSEDDNNEDDM